MRPMLIYFRETHLGENNKFTLDFLDQQFVQEIQFLSENKYYITSLNCKLKLKKYIDEDEKIKKLSEKSKLLRKKGATYLCDIDYLMLQSEWFIKTTNNIYKFKQDRKIINTYSYKYKFWIQQKKQLEMDKSTRHILNFLEKVLILKEKL